MQLRTGDSGDTPNTTPTVDHSESASSSTPGDDNATTSATNERKSPHDADDEDEDEIDRRPMLQLMSNSAFGARVRVFFDDHLRAGYNEARARLQRLFAQQHHNDDEAMLVVAFQVNIESQNMVGECVHHRLSLVQVRALGALLQYLEAHRVGVELDDNSVSTPITNIATITMYDFDIFKTFFQYFSTASKCWTLTTTH